MYLTDFEFDGFMLSDFGCIVCSFDSGNSIETISNGSNINFITTPVRKGDTYLLADTNYDQVLTASFQICKNPCLFTGSDAYFTVEEMTDLMRWLNRKTFHKLVLNANEYEILYFEGSFNVEKIELQGNIIGANLNLTTNRPYAYGNPVTIQRTFNFNGHKERYLFKDTSDEIGFIYPDMKITILSAGDFVLQNTYDKDHPMIIKDCLLGEVIHVKYPVITTSMPEHNIADCFNYNFFRISNSWDNRVNELECPGAARLEMTYNPIRKVGI